MPIYEYECKTCGEQAERIQRHTAAPPVCSKDPKHGAMSKKVSQSSFKLEGFGWGRSGYAG